MQTRISFVEQFYYPEGWGGAQIPRDITIEFVRAGYQVSVYCGSEQYVSTLVADAVDPEKFGVAIHHVARYRLPFKFGKRVLSQLWFCALTSMTIVFRPKPSVFVVQTNPPLIVVALSLIAAFFRRPLVIVAQDVYPEVMIANGMLSGDSVFGRFLKAIFRSAYRHARCVVSLGPQMTVRLIEKGVLESRICEISNWATGDLASKRASKRQFQGQELTGNFILLYCGNLGAAHDVDTLIRAVALARMVTPRLRLLIVGTGSRVPEARQLVDELGLRKEVIFSASVRSDLLPQVLGLADVALVTLLPEFSGFVVPSKLLGYMARGIPTLYIGPGDGDVARLIAKSEGGISISNGAVEELSQCIADLADNPALLERMGCMAAGYYKEKLTREKGLFLYCRMLQSVLNETCTSQAG